MIAIEDYDLFAEKTSKIINSEYQFSTLFIWQELFGFQYEMYNNTIIIFGYQHNGNLQCYFPLGPKEELPGALSKVVEIFHSNNKPVNFRPLNQEMKDDLTALIDFKYIIGSKESYSDYIYDFNAIRLYDGHTYKRKRKEWRAFNSLYDYTYETITSENRNECFDALKRMASEGLDPDQDEITAYRRAFSAFDQLNLRGGIIRIDGIIAAVAVGEALGNMVLMHIRRADKHYRGIYPAMLKLVLNNEFYDRPYSIVNTQDDMGVLNIRKAKMAYNPKFLLKKYFIIEDVTQS